MSGSERFIDRYGPWGLVAGGSKKNTGFGCGRWQVGLLLCNAAVSPIGHFLQQEPETHRRVIGLNCLCAQKLAHWFGRRMAERRRGGIVRWRHSMPWAGNRWWCRACGTGLLPG